jgi:hypothetical protein
MGFGKKVLEWMKPAAQDDDLTASESLSANQAGWLDILGGSQEEGGWKQYAAGGLGFLSWVGYETGLVDIVLPKSAEEVYASSLEQQFEEHGSVYTDAFYNAVSSKLRGIMYVCGWILFTAPATLVLPIISELNQRVHSLDPLLRPPRNGTVKQFNPVSNIVVLMSRNITFDPIPFATGDEGSVVDFNPIPMVIDTSVIRIGFNPIIP